MAGYTPLFDSLSRGTLYGRWPDIGLWAVVLSLTDRHGVVDVTPAFLAGVTGLPESEVIECMARFCAPDPHSRTGTEAGARLILIDPSRAWGWRVVNHAKYREKARLMGKDAARTASGRDAERKRKSRVPRCPPISPSHTHTQTHTQTREERADALPGWLDKQAWKEWTDFRIEIRKPLTQRSIRQQLAFLEQQPDHAAVLRQSVRNGWTGLYEMKGRGEGPPVGDAATEQANRDRLAGLVGGIKRVPK